MNVGSLGWKRPLALIAGVTFLILVVGVALMQMQHGKGTAIEDENLTEEQKKILASLPPDPGEAGKATVAGIDSDGDGVRDDIQRYIALTYHDSVKTRAALTQVTKRMQTELLDATNKQASIADVTAGVNAMDCLYFIVGSSNVRTIFNELKARILNTRERSEASILFNQQIGGQGIGIAPIGERKSRCTFNPDTMEN